MTLLTIWERFLDSLDSSGGHVALLLVLLLVGAGMTHYQIAKGEDVLMGAFGALLLALKSAHSNFTRHGGNDTGTPPPQTEQGHQP